MHWLRFLNLALEVGGCVMAAVLLSSINNRGDKIMRSFMIYLPLVNWVTLASLCLSSGTFLFQNKPLTIGVFTTLAICVTINAIQIMLIRKYRVLPVHSPRRKYRVLEEEPNYIMTRRELKQLDMLLD